MSAEGDHEDIKVSVSFKSKVTIAGKTCPVGNRKNIEIAVS